MEQTPSPAPREKKTAVKLIVSATLLVGVLVLYYLWVTQWSAEAQRAREYQEKYERATNFIQVMEDALRNDIYGGKTPEETLAMFVAALEEGDIDLASKYFTLETNTSSENYLSWNGWKEILTKTRDTKGTTSVLDVLKDMEPGDYSDAFGSYKKRFEFVAKDLNGEAYAHMSLVLSEWSNIWKIESL